MELHEYQKRLANFIALHPHCVISVDMGLGKTASVLAYLNWHIRKHNATRGLIVAPKRVAENNWHTEAEKWQCNEVASRCVVVKGTKQKRVEAINDQIHSIKIISRDNLKDVAFMSFDWVVFDELTSFKSISASRTKMARSINAPVKIGLTGTFLANGAVDIYAQCATVGIGWNNINFYGWRANYFRDAMQGSGQQWHKWILRTSLENLLEPVKDNIFTLTAKDYLQIPPVTHNTHKVAIDAEIRNNINELDAFLATEIGGEMVAVREGGKFAKLQTLVNGFVYDQDGRPIRSDHSTKLTAVADCVADCVEQGENVLLFYAFREEAEWLLELLKARGCNCYDVKKNDFLQKWNNDEIDVLLAHPASAGHGLNLQHGGRVIIWSTLTYNYELFAQGNARLARQGQRNNVQIHYFVGEKTCEENAVASLIKKQSEQNEFLKLTKQ